MPDTSSPWQPIASVPKAAKRLDLWAKRWNASTDTFVEQRFPDCSWDTGDSMCNRSASWRGVADGWRPTHWMHPPEPPCVDAAEAGAKAAMQGCAEAFDGLATDYVAEGLNESASALQFAAGYIRDRLAEDV